ncbi:MAG: peptidoglycan-binding domain-containing protein [Pseudorhodobacter sp.]|nr:peptidoglycan-binding domain-containing protein [Pseudorhodobacter sp.]
MLPTVIKAPSLIKMSVIAITAMSISLTASAPAHAFGKGERSFLQGVAATLLVGAIVRDARSRTHTQTYVQPQSMRPMPVQRGYVPVASIYRTPAAQAFNSYSYSQRRTIQQRLAAQGYYHSGIDGSFGPGTYNAIVAYAGDTGNAHHLGSMSGAFGVYDSLIY